MMKCVSLQRLPGDLQFPPELGQRIQYDESQHQLRFDGYMSKTDFDKLVCLTNDLEYQRALERLFQVCIFEDGLQDARSRLKCYFLLGGTAAVVAALSVLAFMLL
jgi:hypothetical protein